MITSNARNQVNSMSTCAQAVWISTVLSGGLLLSISAASALVHRDVHSLQAAMVGLSMLALGNFQLNRQKKNYHPTAVVEPARVAYWHPDAVRELQLDYLRRRQGLAHRLGSPAVFASQRNTALVRGI